MTFGFSLCAMPLQAVPVTYFRLGTKNLGGGKPLEGGKVYYR